MLRYDLGSLTSRCLLGAGLGIALMSANPTMAQDTAPREVPERKAEADSPRPFLGVFGGDSADEDGAVVAGVVPDSPAAEAGLEEGDVIRSVDGKGLTGFEALAETVRSKKPGDELKLDVTREGEKQELTVTLRPAPERPTPQAPGLGNEPFGGLERFPQFGGGRPFALPMPGGEMTPEAFRRWMERFAQPGQQGGNAVARRMKLGVQLQAIDDSLRERLELGDVEGALVAHVMPNTPADQAGIRSTDVIIAIDGEGVAAPEDVIERIGSREAGDEIELTLWRDGKTFEAKVELADTPQTTQAPPMPNMQRFQMVDPGQLDAMEKRFQERIEQLEQKIEKLEKELEGLRD